MGRYCIAVVAVALAAGGIAPAPSARGATGGCQSAVDRFDREPDKAYSFHGNARVVSDITHKETWWPVGGTVYASTRQEALELARAAAHAQAAIAGSVVSVDVYITN